MNKIEWKEIELGKIISCTMGQAPSSNSYNNVGEGTPFVKVSEFGSKFPRISIWTTSPQKFAKEGDVLVCVVGSIGKVNNSISCAIGRSVAALSPDKRFLHNYFLYYFLAGNKKLLENLGEGTTQGVITQKDLTSISIKLPFSNNQPDLNEQERIVQILEKAERLKERSKKAEKLLDEYLKSIFNEMFTEKGFEEVKLETITKFKGGGTPSRANKDYFTGRIPWITTVSLRKKYIDENDAVEFITEKAIEESSTKIIPKNSIMVGTRVGVGKISINRTDMCTSQDITSLTNIDKRIIHEYLLFFLTDKSDYLISHVRGATIKGIPSSVLKQIKIPIPPLPLQQKFSSIVEQVEKIKENINKSQNNSEDLFNSLMQKAFRGDI